MSTNWKKYVFHQVKWNFEPMVNTTKILVLEKAPLLSTNTHLDIYTCTHRHSHTQTHTTHPFPLPLLHLNVKFCCKYVAAIERIGIDKKERNLQWDIDANNSKINKCVYFKTNFQLHASKKTCPCMIVHDSSL